MKKKTIVIICALELIGFLLLAVAPVIGIVMIYSALAIYYVATKRSISKVYTEVDKVNKKPKKTKKDKRKDTRQGALK